jgi:SAM-dependent methyltransferase
MALGAWMCRHFGSAGSLAEMFGHPTNLPTARVLEVNEAGQLTQFLRKLPNHTLATYPEVDIHKLPYEDDYFDIVVHSDTLEHVVDPIRAMSECRRVLRPNGKCAFTVPVIANRLTRSTSRGLPSYHGHSGHKGEDFKVRTEFGADCWKVAIGAGFTEVSVFALEYPAALVHVCSK